jgi:DNA (cytosine-5)-methyltransferase 3A
MKVLSLFDGISCGRIALDRAGITVDRYVAYEIDLNAINISHRNYPNIERGGDVVNADFNKYKGFDLLIGGSPCTYWSVARTDGKREVKPEAIGWQLFMEYARALKESECKYFLYENNYSISSEIKDYISKVLGVQPIMIDSALVSAQRRRRCYWTNIPNVKQPADRNVILSDIVDFSKESFRPVGNWVFNKWGDTIKIKRLKDVDSKKSHTLTTSKTHPMNYYLSRDKKTYCNLTVTDWEKLQTLPVGYVNKCDVKTGAKYKAIGNGWTVDVIAHILKGIKEKARNKK